MARRKNAPESIRVKQGLSDRLRSLRTEFYGERGGPDLARTLGIPVRTWYNYENGVTVPAEIILRIVELTSVEPIWLLRGEGPKLRPKAPGHSRQSSHSQGLADSSVATLLRTALERLEQKERDSIGPLFGPTTLGPRDESESNRDDPGMVLFGVNGEEGVPLTPADGPRYDAARGEWLAARRAFRHLRMADDSMSPIVAERAHVAYAEAETASEALHDKLVVAWVGGEPIVRWFQHCGRYALLRAENPAAADPSILVDLEGTEKPSFHRVLWISTPH
jgi:hypothetical protein